MRANFIENIDAWGDPISGPDDLRDRMSRAYALQLRDGTSGFSDRHGDAIPASRHDSAAADAGEDFLRSMGAKLLSAINRKPSSTALTLPGPEAVVPVRQELDRGDTHLTWEVETPTGRAAFVDPKGVQKLPQVGEFVEVLERRSDWTGVGWGAGLTELWQAQARNRDIMSSRGTSARDILGRFNEKIGLEGNLSRQIPGLKSNGEGYRQILGTGFAAITVADDALRLLQIINEIFMRLADSYGGTITTVVAPQNDLYALQRLRWPNGDAALPDYMVMFPWLRDVRWINGMDTAASTGGAMWIVMSDDANELWNELSPAPMLFGPFQESASGLRTSWAAITHIAGIVLRRRERLARFEFAAP
jgi:hypothetical protein